MTIFNKLRKIFTLLFSFIVILILPAQSKNKLPIIYHEQYNVSFLGLEKLHSFDTQKYGTVAHNFWNYLVEKACIDDNNDLFLKIMRNPDTNRFGPMQKIVKRSVIKNFSDVHYFPEIVTNEDLLIVHSQNYLDSLNSSETVAQIAEVWPLAFIPNFILQRGLLRSIKLATGNSWNRISVKIWLVN